MNALRRNSGPNMKMKIPWNWDNSTDPSFKLYDDQEKKSYTSQLSLEEPGLQMQPRSCKILPLPPQLCIYHFNILRP